MCIRTPSLVSGYLTCPAFCDTQQGCSVLKTLNLNLLRAFCGLVFHGQTCHNYKNHLLNCYCSSLLGGHSEVWRHSASSWISWTTIPVCDWDYEKPRQKKCWTPLVNSVDPCAASGNKNPPRHMNSPWKMDWYLRWYVHREESNRNMCQKIRIKTQKPGNK